MNVLAFDVGGTSIKYGLVSDTLEIINKDKFPTPKNEEKLIDISKNNTVFKSVGLAFQDLVIVEYIMDNLPN